MPAENDTGAAYQDDPVSSGPYAITSVDPVAGIVLDRNPAWTPDSDPVRTALPDQVVVRTGLNGLDRDQAVLAGSADADLSGTGVQEATTARADGDDAVADRVDDVTTGSVRLLALPTTVTPMTSPDCRAAVAAVVDRTAVQDAWAGGRRRPDLGAVAPVVARRTGGPRPGPGPRRRPAVAGGVRRPRRVRHHHGRARRPSSLAVAESLVGQFAEVGIEVTVAPLDPATFYTDGIGSPQAIADGGYGMVLATWTSDLPTPASFLVPLVDGRSISQQRGNSNYGLLADPAVDALVDTAVGAGDVAAWAAVADAALATHAVVPLAENRVQLLAGQRLRNGVVMLPWTGYDVATAGVGGG